LRLCETQQTPQNVGFRSSTQPTHFYFLGLTEQYWNQGEVFSDFWVIQFCSITE
jgi:hypothetical protein